MMDVVILAGGNVNFELSKYCIDNKKALLKLNNLFLIEKVLGEFKKSKLVNKIFIVGSESIKNNISNQLYDYFIYEGNNIIDNLDKIFSHEKINLEKKVLISACDLPFITTSAINNFINFAINNNAVAIYPVVEKNNYEKVFKNTKRTWFNCKDGTYTGSNFIVIKPKVFLKNKSLINEIINNRKNPLKLAQIFGISFVLKYQLGYITPSDVVNMASSLIKMPCATLISNFPEIAFDIDKLEDYIFTCELIKNFNYF